MWQKGNCTRLVERYIGTDIMEKSMDFHKKTKSGTSIWSSDLSSEYIHKGKWITIVKRCLYSHIHCRITHNNQAMEYGYRQWNKQRLIVVRSWVIPGEMRWTNTKDIWKKSSITCGVYRLCVRENKVNSRFWLI